MKIWYVSIILFIGLFIHLEASAQIGDKRFDDLKEELDFFSKKHNNLRQKIDISALGSVQEIITSIAQQTKINITIDPSINEPVVSNFTKVRVEDLLLYFCRQYNLDLAFSGSIITVFRYKAPTIIPPPKTDDVVYNGFNSFLRLNLQDDTLEVVAKKITQQSGINVIPSQAARNLKVSGYIDKVSVEDGLKLLAASNNLQLTATPEGAYYLSTKEEEPPIVEDPKGLKRGGHNLTGITYEDIENLEVYTYQDSSTGVMRVSIIAQNVPFLQIIKAVSVELEKDYFLFEEAKKKTNNQFGNNQQNAGQGISMKLEDATYDEFLAYILQGTNLTYKIDEEIYLIGDRTMEGLRQTKVIQLQYRSAQDIEKVIPDEIAQNVKINPFPELNAIILSGSAPNIREVEALVAGIDKLVPVVMIELIIMDVQRNRVTETGVQIGVGEAPVEDQVQLSPGIDVTFGSGSINKLLETLAGRGIINLGRVVPNFYVSLQAMEDAGITKTRSKPQLATLNSHEASFNIGETRYYQEARTTVQGSLGSVTQQDINFKSVQANFTITVTPFVSGDEQITLNVVVEQSDFLGEVQLGAPPAQISRKFDSKIRVRNGDMIALGGLESDRKERSSRGIPGLARVPVLSLLGRKKNTRSGSELLIFIKPTIVY